MDAGITLFDTAETYGNGRYEEMLGEALGARRDEAVIATKVFFGTDEDPEVGLSGGHLRRSCEDSIRRLRTDRIDLLQIHGWDGMTPLHETLAALDELVSSGKVRTVGVSNWPAWHDRLGEADLASLGRYREMEPEDGLHRPLPGFDVIPGSGQTPRSDGGGSTR